MVFHHPPLHDVPSPTEVAPGSPVVANASAHIDVSPAGAAAPKASAKAPKPSPNEAGVANVSAAGARGAHARGDEVPRSKPQPGPPSVACEAPMPPLGSSRRAAPIGEADSSEAPAKHALPIVVGVEGMQLEPKALPSGPKLS